ncbi:unnamed protein product [Echinostoma caproni]|uniref:Reverse transcriptase domain-containing protein n=1 Tax=Echinostoma caproni TaxID=27848 RepID=A0A183BGH3_9TREM|nr:unnamed protein product [Echinostoma caproni]
MANGNIASTDKDRAEALMDYFKSVYRSSPDDGVRNHMVDTIGNEMRVLIVSKEEVRTELTSLCKHKAAGPDEIHPAIVQPLAEVILGPVTDLFKVSLTAGVVPEDWRKATVVAINKTGSRQKAENYRPVSLTSVLRKCLERIVRNQICAHLVTHGLLSLHSTGLPGISRV